jgi:putative ABC transport system permease protein
MSLVLRTTVPPLTLTSAVRKAVQAIDRNQPIADVTTLDAWVGKSLSKRRFSMLVLTLFAALGVALAMIGIYGVLSYSVSQRTQEIGIRMALGAAPRDVLRLVIGQGLVLALTGLLIGTLGGLLATRALGSMLFEVEPTDPSVYLLIGLGLTAVAMGASYLPARRAGRLDPLTSLKYN